MSAKNGLQTSMYDSRERGPCISFRQLFNRGMLAHLQLPPQLDDERTGGHLAFVIASGRRPLWRFGRLSNLNSRNWRARLLGKIWFGLYPAVLQLTNCR